MSNKTRLTGIVGASTRSQMIRGIHGALNSFSTVFSTTCTCELRLFEILAIGGSKEEKMS
jgi:hypothetical protein